MGSFVEPDGVGLGSGGSVYVADAASHVLDLFGPAVVLPDAITGKALKIGKTSVILHGVLDGEGKPAKYRFQWGTSEAYGSTTTTENTGAGEEKVAVELTGLAVGTTYHYRLVSENENGMNVGVDRQFTTLPAVEALSTGLAQDVTQTSVTLTGSLSPKARRATTTSSMARAPPMATPIPHRRERARGRARSR